MTLTAAAPATSTTSGRAARRAGRAISALAVAFLVVDAVSKLLQVPAVVDATTLMGFRPGHVPVIGAVLLVCVAIHLVPRTAVLGAVLLTGYLGGAVCAQLRIDAPLLGTMLFPVYMGALIWVGLYLRSAALRALVRAGS